MPNEALESGLVDDRSIETAAQLIKAADERGIGPFQLAAELGGGESHHPITEDLHRLGSESVAALLDAEPVATPDTEGLPEAGTPALERPVGEADS